MSSTFVRSDLVIRAGVAMALSLPSIGPAIGAGAGTFARQAYGTDTLKLLDPGAPLSANNPVTVDAGIPVADQAGFRNLVAADVSGTVLSRLRRARLVYTKAGRVYAVNLDAGTSAAPVRISAIGDACAITAVEDDLSAPENALVQVQRRGADRRCFSADDVRTMIRSAAPVSDGGVTPLAPTLIAPIHGAARGIVGFLSVEGGVAPALVHRDAGFGHPATIVNLASSSAASLEVASASRLIFLQLTPAGRSAPQLFRYDEKLDDGTLSPALYSFVATRPDAGRLGDGSYDSAFLYYPDGNRLLRTPFAASAAAQTRVIAAPDLGSGGNIRSVHLTAFSRPRLVFDVNDQSHGDAPPCDVFSVAKSAGATPLCLAAEDPDNETFYQLDAIGGGQIYVTRHSFGIGQPDSAFVIADDGGSRVEKFVGNWVGKSIPTTIDLGKTAGSGSVDPLFVAGVRLEFTPGSDGPTGHLVSVGTSPGGGTPREFGSSPPGACGDSGDECTIRVDGIGRYVAVGSSYADEEEGEDVSYAHLIDSLSPGSLQFISLGLPRDR